jgi:hypothetical protein
VLPEKRQGVADVLTTSLPFETAGDRFGVAD